MTTAPLVSVIIPAFNAGQYILESLQSILRQDYRNLEILICDDASTDETSKLLGLISDSRIRIFRNESNIGYLRSVNFLVAHARGEFICFQDADDISHHERIKLQVNQLLRAPSIGFLGTNYAIVSKTGRTILERNVETEPGKIKELIKTSNPFQKPSILFRREVYEQVGMYREEFLKLGNISEDFDWILRASERFDPGNINHEVPLYLYRSVPNAMSKSFSNVTQLFGHSVALKLHGERLKGHKDSIEKGDWQAIREFIDELKKPFELNKSLFYHKRAEALMYAGLRVQAIKQAMHAVKTEPLRFANYRLLQHCIRKTFIRL